MQLSRIRKIKQGPASLHFFIDIMEAVFSAGDPSRYLCSHANDRVYIGVYCMLIPEEIIYAAGATPIRLCGGCYEAAQIGEDYVPRDGCPLVKSSMGFSVRKGMAVYDLCDVVIIPTTCDVKRKLGEELSQFKEVWILEVPHIKDSEISRCAWLEQIYALKKKLEKYLHNKCGIKKISAGDIGGAIKKVAQAQFEMRRFLGYRMQASLPIWGRQAMLIANAYAYLSVADWTDALSRVNDELAKRMENSAAVCSLHTPRIFLAGSPVIFPNWKIPTLIEEMGGVVVCDESCTGDRYLYDPVGNSENTLQAQMIGISSRYLMPCVCPSFTPNEDRLVKIERIIDDYRVDGVIYHILKGCVVYDFEVNRVENILMKRNIPIMRLETDYNPEDLEQLRTRIEAFIDMLKAKKQHSQER